MGLQLTQLETLLLDQVGPLKLVSELEVIRNLRLELEYLSENAVQQSQGVRSPAQLREQ